MRDNDAVSPDPVLDALLRELRRPIRPASHAAERALAGLASRRRRGPFWAAAAILVLAVGLSLFRGRREPHPVRFALRAPASARVALIGDFNDWDASRSPLQEGQGEWTATLRLKPGRYRYSFVVDGSRWVADPHGATAGDDDFGTPTSVITVAR